MSTSDGDDSIGKTQPLAQQARGQTGKWHYEINLHLIRDQRPGAGRETDVEEMDKHDGRSSAKTDSDCERTVFWSAEVRENDCNGKGISLVLRCRFQSWGPQLKSSASRPGKSSSTSGKSSGKKVRDQKSTPLLFKHVQHCISKMMLSTVAVWLAQHCCWFLEHGYHTFKNIKHYHFICKATLSSFKHNACHQSRIYHQCSHFGANNIRLLSKWMERDP